MARKSKDVSTPFPVEDDPFQMWKKRIHRTNSIWGDHRAFCQKYYDAYEGLFRRGGLFGGGPTDYANLNPDYIGIPLAFAHLKFRIPNLILKNSYFTVKARTPFTIESSGDLIANAGPMGQAITPSGQMVRDNVLGAEILENALNYEMKEMAFKPQARAAITDAHFSYGVIKVGYHTEFTPNLAKNMVEQLNAEEGEDVRAELEWNNSVKRESVWALRVDPWDVRWDPDIKMIDPELSQCRWMAFRSVRPLEEVRNDPLYKNTKDLEASKYPEEENPIGRSLNDIKDEPYVTLWEIWDKRKRRIYVMAEENVGFLRDDPWPYDMDGFPMALLFFNDQPNFRNANAGTPAVYRIRGPFPIPDLHEWYELNHSINIAESISFESLRRRMDKIAVVEGQIDEAELQKLQQPLNKGVVKVKDMNAIKELKASPSNGEEGAVIGRMSNWLYQISGLGANQRSQATGGTATESAIVQNNSEARQAESLDRVKDWTLVIARKLVALMKQYFTKRRIVPVMGREDFEWLPYTRDNIQGEYDLDVELAPFNPQKQDVAIKQLTDLIALLSKLPQVPDGAGNMYGVNLAKLIEQLMLEMRTRVKPREVLMPLGPMPPQIGVSQNEAVSGTTPPGGIGPPAAPSGPPLPGEGEGADRRSPIASQGVGRSMVQSMLMRNGIQPAEGGMGSGASTPSRGF